MNKFKLRYMDYFPNILAYCIAADGCQGGTIHQYVPRLSVGGPAKGHRYGVRPVVQIYLNNKPVDRAWAQMKLSDLED